MLHFEVSLQRDLKICISFQHPNGESLSCVVVDVLCSRKLACRLYTNASDPPLPSSSEFITKVLECCMSIPITMRSIFKKTNKPEITQKMETLYADSDGLLPQASAEYPPEAVADPSHNGPQETMSKFENAPVNEVYDPNEDFFPEPIGVIHSNDALEPSPCPTQDPNSSLTEDSYFNIAAVNSSAIEEPNSNHAEESYSSLGEEPNSSIEQELSPIMAEVPSSNTEGDPSSSITGELSSSITEELSLNFSGYMMPKSVPEEETNECY
ncbi:uncharacterized protein LOC142127199 [Mixophyes fleayi]|uniref:uncharacterized protein LOC142112147 n=1 Tax=Mixophyes fleayi TaxID=3061075 RepID=UPI003F4D98A4